MWHSEVPPLNSQLIRICDQKKILFLAILGRNLLLWPVSTKWRPPSVIHRWKAMAPLPFAKSARFNAQKNSTLGAETKKRRPLFNANIPPKWRLTRLFYAFVTFGWVLSQFKNLAFFCRFDPLKRLACKKNTYMGRKGPRAKTKTVLKTVCKTTQLGNMHKYKFWIWSK